MAKLTENTVRTFESNEDVNTVLVAAGVHIFQGEFIGINGGYARPYEKGDTVAGFAQDEVDNTDGDNGAKTVDVRGRGKVCIELPNLSQESSIGATVLITEDGELSTETGDACFGKVLRLEDPTHAIVGFDFIYQQEIAIATTSQTTEG